MRHYMLSLKSSVITVISHMQNILPRGWKVTLRESKVREIQGKVTRFFARLTLFKGNISVFKYGDHYFTKFHSNRTRKEDKGHVPFLSSETAT